MDEIKKMAAGHSIEVLDVIMSEVEEARGEYDSLGERLDEMSSGTPAPSTAAPAMDGTAAAGTSTDYARADHVHPSDTSRASAASEAEDRAALIELVDGGAKNARNITLDEIKVLGGNAGFTWVGNVATKNNVSFTINSDGTITVDATQAASAQVILDIYRTPSDVENMVLSGCPVGGDSEKYFQYVKGTTYRDFGDGVVYSKTGAHSIGLVIANGYRPQNLIFKPMLCTQAAWDISHAYQPYRPSEDEQNEQIEINKNNILSKIGIEDVYGAGREILSNGTMNDTTLGKFFCAGASISETVEGAPWTDSGYYGWTERSISASGRYVQIAIKNDSNFTIAKRRYTGTWSAWAYISSV